MNKVQLNYDQELFCFLKKQDEAREKHKSYVVARENYKSYLQWRIDQLAEEEDGKGIQLQLDKLLTTLPNKNQISKEDFRRRGKLVMAVDIEHEKKKDIATFKEDFRSLILDRLKDEWKAWRQKPFVGFIAKPDKNPDGTDNFWLWKCTIPGRIGTELDRLRFRVRLHFTAHFPSFPPDCEFEEPYFHPNISETGRVDIDNSTWKPSMGVKHVLSYLQNKLHNPDTSCRDLMNDEAYTAFMTDERGYYRKVRKQAIMSLRSGKEKSGDLHGKKHIRVPPLRTDISRSTRTELRKKQTSLALHKRSKNSHI